MAQIPARKCGFCNKAVGDLFCEDCHQILCVKCRQDVHDKVPFLQDHKVTSIQKEGNRVFRPQPVCETHKNQFLYYCSKCECLTCAECMTSNHNEHKTEKIKTVADTCRQTVIHYMETTKTKVELVKKKLETIDTEHSAQIKSDCESYVSKVTITSGELHEIIDRFKQIHMTTASDFKDIENQDLHNKRAFFKRRHDEIVDRLLKFENLLQETHDSIFLTEWKALQTVFKINDDETDDPLACPRQLALFNQSSFTKSVIEEIDEKFQMRLKENENSVNELQIENSKLKAEINFKKDENEKLARDLDIKADDNEQLIKQFEDKIKDLETKLNLAEKKNTGTPKALTDLQISGQQNSHQTEDDQKELTKHRSEIILGTKHETKDGRDRSVADPSDKYIPLSKDDVNGTKKKTNFPLASLFKNYNPSGGSYSTPEGMTIKVYVGNTLKLDVECIVNAANENLAHGGGEAAIISEAAGYEFDQESAEYVKRYGTLPVGTCCSTSAGKLHYKYVIHTVGPRWFDYKHDEKKICAMDLKQSIVCCFEEAEKLQLKSIALPTISAGIFGVPKEVCVAEYKNAVADFSRNSKGGFYLKEIHFIDKDLGLISLIQHEFNSIFQQSSKSGGLTSAVGKKDFRRSMSSGSNDEKCQQGASVGGNRSNRFNQSTNGKIGVYVVKQKLKLEVKTGDITKCEIDGIVCPQDEYLCNLGRIAKEIEKIGGHEYKSDLLKLRTMKLTGAKRMNAPTKCPWKYVIQAVPPRWNLEATRNPNGFEKNLKNTVLNILNETKQSRIKILAVPLMGIAEKGETPVEAFADQLARAVLKQVEDRDFTVEEIHVMVQDMNDVKKIVGVLDTKKEEGIQKELKSSHRSHTGRSVKAMVVEDVETGDVSGGCCICMEKFDNQKTLVCGHVFCTECIEKQFNYKLSCPQCGQIHGVVTGTQPDGRMNIRTKKYSLPGYYATHTFEVEYIIYSGKQGEEHPNPGRLFEGITRTAYLPENKKGKIVLKLLEVAFKRKLVFTIGTSTTSGKTGVVTWNDIHHKTNPKPNTQFGYPDDTYLDRVLEELAAKGITEKDLQD